MPTWDEINEEVQNNGNVHTLTMLDLRDAAGKEKLGVHVKSEIKSKLAGMGLGHVPAQLPSYQHEQIRLYKRGTAIGNLIETVLSPGGQNDVKLRESTDESTAEYQSIIEQIRDLVAE